MTRTTARSQTCVCSRQRKKSLSERVDRCECGGIMHRDLMSGFLSRYVDQHRLSLPLATDSWTGLEPILQAAGQPYEHSKRVSESEIPQFDPPAEKVAGQPVSYIQTKLFEYAEDVV